MGAVCRCHRCHMIETTLVMIIVGLAAFYVGRTFYKNAKKGENSCGCGCTACNIADTCNDSDNR